MSVYEGVTFALLDSYKHIPHTPNKIKLTGGGSKSPFWRQMIADMTGFVVELTNSSEFGAKGATLTTGVATKIYKNFDNAVSKTITKKHQLFLLYRMLKIYNELQITNTFHQELMRRVSLAINIPPFFSKINESCTIAMGITYSLG